MSTTEQEGRHILLGLRTGVQVWQGEDPDDRLEDAVDRRARRCGGRNAERDEVANVKVVGHSQTQALCRLAGQLRQDGRVGSGDLCGPVREGGEGLCGDDERRRVRDGAGLHQGRLRDRLGKGPAALGRQSGDMGRLRGRERIARRRENIRQIDDLVCLDGTRDARRRSQRVARTGLDSADQRRHGRVGLLQRGRKRPAGYHGSLPVQVALQELLYWNMGCGRSTFDLLSI